jgi:hypothetical protein
METKALKKLKEELEYWTYYESVNNMGKWSKQVRVDKLKEQIENLETLTGFAAQFYSGSDENEKLIFTEGFVEAVRVMGSLEQDEVIETESGSYDDLFKKKAIAHKN